MSQFLDPSEFTDHVAAQLSGYEQLQVSAPEPLVVSIYYGLNEPVLTLKLEHAYEEYKKEPQQLSVILQPVITEVGWTVNGKRYSYEDIAQHTLPLLRDLKLMPFRSETDETDSGIAFDEEEQSLQKDNPSRGPLVYSGLVNRPEEDVVVQLVLAKNELIRPLYMGDVLRSCPEPNQLMSVAVHNLRRQVLSIGLTLSEYEIENFATTPWLVGFRQGLFRRFLASLIIVPEVMATLQGTLQAEDGLLAILPARDQLLVCPAADEDLNAQMGMLATHLKKQASEPVSCFIWHFVEGSLRRVQTIDYEHSEQT